MPKLVYPDNTFYFLTSSAFLHYPYFKEAHQKQILLNQIKKAKKDLGIPVVAYSIAINHQHSLFYLGKDELYPKIKQLIHGGTSFEYKKHWPTKHDQFWQTQKTYSVRDESSYWKILGYIIGNLLKHKEVSTFEELKENHFSSYWHITEKYDNKFAQSLVREVINLPEDNKRLIDFKNLKDINISKPNKNN